MSIDKDLVGSADGRAEARALFGKDGILQELTKALAEGVLSTELDEHLTEARSDPPPEGGEPAPEPAQWYQPEDGDHRQRQGGSGHPARPERQL